MRLADVYSVRKVSKASGWKQAKKFFMNPDTKYRFDFLNDIDEPSITDIVDFQKENVLEMKGLQEAQEILQNINYDIKNKVPLPPFSPEEVISNIESLISSENGLGQLARDQNQIDAVTLKNLLLKHKDLISQLSLLYNSLKNSSINGTTSAVISALKKFNQALVHLTKDAAKVNTASPNFTFSNRGYLSRLNWVEWVLKGQYLESSGTDFLKKRLPSNIKAVNTGAVYSVYFDVLGKVKYHGKPINEDIMLFNEKDLGIQLSYKIGDITKTGTIDDFIEECEKAQGNMTIALPQTDYETLRSVMISGVSAKSGAGNIKFRKITLNEVIDVRDNFGIKFALKSLFYLTQAPYSSKRILGTNDIYDSLFNYLLGRSLGKIIGSTNKIMLTRKGFSTVQDYLLERFEEGYAVMALNKRAVNLRRPDKQIPVGIKKI